MKNNMFRKGLVIGIIALFIVVSAVQGTVSDVNTTGNDFSFNDVTTVDLSDGLVGYWSFDFGDASDESGNGNDGTIYGANLVDGVSGGAYDYDGIDDYVNVEHSDSLEVGDSFSISIWVKPRTDGIEFVTKAPQYHPWTGFCLRYYSGNEVGFKVYNETGTKATVKKVINITDENWHHLVGTYDGLTVKLFIDGVLEDNINLTGEADNKEPLTFGYDTPEWTGNWSDGLIDEIRFYNRALEEVEIQELLNYEIELTSTILLGRFSNLNEFTDLITFEATKIRCIKFCPPSFNTYQDSERIRISSNPLGLVGINFIFAFCKSSL